MLCLLMNQGKTTQIRCSNLGHLPQIWANLLFFLSFSNRNYFLKKTFLQDPFYEKFSHAETHDSAKKPCRSTHSFSSSSNPEMVPKLPKIGTFLARRTVRVAIVSRNVVQIEFYNVRSSSPNATLISSDHSAAFSPVSTLLQSRL